MVFSCQFWPLMVEFFPICTFAPQVGGCTPPFTPLDPSLFPGPPYSSMVHITARQHPSSSNYHSSSVTHISLLYSHLSHPTVTGSHVTAPPAPPHPTAPQPHLKLLRGTISQLSSLIPQLRSPLYSSMPQSHQSFRRKKSIYLNNKT